MKINQIIAPHHTQNTFDVNAVERVDFGQVLSDAIGAVNDAERVSVAYDEQLASGQIDNLHDAMIAAQKAQITLNFGLQIRKQVLEAYQELMRLQI